MFCATTSLSVWILLVLILCSAFHFSDATIRVLDIGREYQSRPDKYVGLQMKAGLEYDARLQRIPGDQYLCGDGQWNVKVPDDGLPGTFAERNHDDFRDLILIHPSAVLFWI